MSIKALLLTQIGQNRNEKLKFAGVTCRILGFVALACAFFFQGRIFMKQIAPQRILHEQNTPEAKPIRKMRRRPDFCTES